MTVQQFVAITAVGLNFIVDPNSQTIDPWVEGLLAMRDERLKEIAQAEAKLARWAGFRFGATERELSATVRRAREAVSALESEVLHAYGAQARPWSDQA